MSSISPLSSAGSSDSVVSFSNSLSLLPCSLVHTTIPLERAFPNRSALSTSISVVDLDVDIMSEQPFIYDLISELRRNPKRRSAVESALRRIDMVDEARAIGKATRDDVTKAEAAAVVSCGFNFGALIPRFFPRYPLGSPLDFSDRPFMYTMTSQVPGSVVTLKAGRQVGKCADGDTEVITQGGNRTLRDLFDEGRPVTVS